ncbi:zinc-finger domain-containing protein [Cytobacillus praedii]|uniref:Zinc-finger domain-containing protein n=1 Tax=Cytobacillus praedii TaxID=1742358 RepID=A0A4R1AWM9_9BACI|nr:zinc-finger domain-containing protein [Cytobacillus praedii]TCJ04880.1 zinc-finger domain-containing protein [Cytobacillus praedii]
MSREIKRKIRIQIHELIESECMDCQYRRGYENAHFCVNECPVGKELKSLSESLEGKNKESSDQLLNKGRWTEEEVFYLLNHLDLFKIPHLASKLNRPPGAVHSKAASLKKRLKASSF